MKEVLSFRNLDANKMSFHVIVDIEHKQAMLEFIKGKMALYNSNANGRTVCEFMKDEMDACPIRHMFFEGDRLEVL